MVLRNHIAYRFLTDSTLCMEMCSAAHPEDWKELVERAGNSLQKGDIDLQGSDELNSFIRLVNPRNQKAYIVTNSVMEKLEFLKLTKKGIHFNWTVFRKLSPQKITLILPDNRLLRIMIEDDDVIELFWLKFDKAKVPGPNIDGNMKWVMLYFNTKTGALCEHFDHPDALEIEEFIYKLMCFFYLTDNDEIIISPGKSYGTKKSGKVLNEMPIPVTIVNSRWNTTVIQTEQFGVRGHFRLQPCGTGRRDSEVIFIEPFVKNGYKRLSGKERAEETTN